MVIELKAAVSRVDDSSGPYRIESVNSGAVLSESKARLLTMVMGVDPVVTIKLDKVGYVFS